MSRKSVFLALLILIFSGPSFNFVANGFAQEDEHKGKKKKDGRSILRNSNNIKIVTANLTIF